MKQTENQKDSALLPDNTMQLLDGRFSASFILERKKRLRDKQRDVYRLNKAIPVIERKEQGTFHLRRRFSKG